MEANFEFSCPKKLSRCPKLDDYEKANFEVRVDMSYFVTFFDIFKHCV